MGVLIRREEDVQGVHRNEHEGYEYIKRDAGGAELKSSYVMFYEIAPGKSNYPYHYHVLCEEVFYILRGQGLLKTPEGERVVGAGDLLVFPSGEEGAHKLTNTSTSEPLSYIDFGSKAPLEVAFYPDSGKVGMYGRGLRNIFMENTKVEYYEGE